MSRRKNAFLTSSLVTAALLAAATLASVNQAQAALIINLDSAVNSSTANVTTGGATDKREFNSVLDTLQGSDSDGDFVGSSVFISTRLSSLTVADKDSGTFLTQAPNTQNATVNYSLTFTVADPGAGRVYDLRIDTSRIGELTVRNDSSNGTATLTLGAITASYTGVGLPSGSNALAGQTLTSAGGNNPAFYNNAFNQAGFVTVAGLTGQQTITLGFSWAQNVTSVNSGGLNSGTGDDGAIRLGRSTTTNGSAGLYPGNNNRNIDLDGHFVTVQATMVVVPEPGTLVMASMAAFGFAFMAVRKRRVA